MILFFVLNIDINRSTNRNIIIINSETINIYVKDVENKQQSNVIAPMDIMLPTKIDKKAHLTSRFVNPAIKLPDHTPVSGNGTATKPVRSKYFLKFDSCLFISKLL